VASCAYSIVAAVYTHRHVLSLGCRLSSFTAFAMPPKKRAPRTSSASAAGAPFTPSAKKSKVDDLSVSPSEAALMSKLPHVQILSQWVTDTVVPAGGVVAYLERNYSSEATCALTNTNHQLFQTVASTNQLTLLCSLKLICAI
jgi:hypothetical protein